MAELILHRVDRVAAPPGQRRARAVRLSGRGAQSHLNYDFATLFYEAVRHRDRVTLVAPKLLNFKDIFRSARFSINGKAVGKLRIRQFYRHTIVHLLGAGPGDRLTIAFADGTKQSCAIHAVETDHLAGLNCEMLISKDNDLNWLEERIAFHTARCDLQGLCLIDTGSTAYGLEALAEMLRATALRRVVLLSMPFPWGGMNLKPAHRELFLQSSAYNLCRIKYLSRARAVVRLDVDEVLKPHSPNVFDLAVAARTGFVCFHGDERYPGPDDTPPFQFKDHIWALPGAEIAGNNWCLNPQGPLGGFQWRCHNLEHNLLNRWQYLDGTHFYHCLGIGTGWKDPDRSRPTKALRVDAEAKAFWRDTFCPVTSRDARS